MKRETDFELLEIISQDAGLNQYMLENYDCRLSNDDLRTIISVWQAAQKNTRNKIIDECIEIINDFKYKRRYTIIFEAYVSLQEEIEKLKGKL